MINRFALFLGPARLRALIVWIAVTGLASLVLNVIVDEYDWVRSVQTLLALAAVVGAGVIVLGRMDPLDRGRWIGILLPALGAVVLGLTVLPQFSLLLFGAALGWIVAGALVFRPKTPEGVRQAVRALRRGDLEQAVEAMDQTIKAEPDNPAHYRFRAELLRLAGKLDRARRDYTRMSELEPNSPIAFNGIAEVELQAGRYVRAHEAAQKAAELAPDEWVALYNLGMIEDRLKQSHGVIEHLTRALELKVPETRHRLLVHVYRARAFARLGDEPAAQEVIAALRRSASGLEEWQRILKDDQAATLRAVIGEDVTVAERLIDGTLTVPELAQTQGGPP
jgi:hypothetical protein